MIVNYIPATPDRGDARSWEFNPDRVPSSECILIEEHYDKPWDAFVARARAGDTKARRLLLWHLMRRDAAAGTPGPHAHVNLKDVPDFWSGEVTVEMNSAELIEFTAKMAKSSALKDNEREIALAQLRDSLIEAYEREGRDAEGNLIGETVAYAYKSDESEPREGGAPLSVEYGTSMSAIG